MKIFIFIITLFSFVLNINAQKEIYFNSTNSKDIKVKSLHGFELGLEPNKANNFGLANSSNLLFVNNCSYYLGYFNEKRIGASCTVNFTAVVHNLFSQANFPFQRINGKINDNKDTSWSLEMANIEVGIEPRWYYLFKHTSQLQNIKNNAGWYLSLPLFANRMLYSRDYKRSSGNGWAGKYGFEIFSAMPSLGYRGSFFDHLIAEASYGMGVTYYSALLFESLVFDTQLKLKLAYVL